MNTDVINITLTDILECWAVGYGAMFILILVVCLAINRKFLKDWVNWVILILVSTLSWFGFAFMLVTFYVVYIDYIKNNNYDKDSEK